VPDISTITAGLNAIKHAIDLTKYLRNISKAIDRAELELKIAELAEALLEARRKLLDVQEETLKLRGVINDMTQIQDFRKKVRIRNGVYYFKERVEGRGVGPYCPRCFDVDKTLVLLSELAPPSRAKGTHQCPNCKSAY